MYAIALTPGEVKNQRSGKSKRDKEKRSGVSKVVEEQPCYSAYKKPFNHTLPPNRFAFKFSKQREAYRLENKKY
jgi:hypothetical protein